MGKELLQSIQGEYGEIRVSPMAASGKEAELQDLYAFLLEAYLIVEKKNAEKPAD
ncbi:hypothetical protein [Brevibacillus migulae]|uniref:hypothetical protein n=1 Tax=Brevibacillus migulae TaxID=1644114 RepID=UPI001430DCE1|nr:hypothetical protein [Brevibacillus migulae]